MIKPLTPFPLSATLFLKEPHPSEKSMHINPATRIEATLEEIWSEETMKEVRNPNHCGGVGNCDFVELRRERKNMMVVGLGSPIDKLEPTRQPFSPHHDSPQTRAIHPRPRRPHWRHFLPRRDHRAPSRFHPVRCPLAAATCAPVSVRSTRATHGRSSMAHERSSFVGRRFPPPPPLPVDIGGGSTGGDTVCSATNRRREFRTVGFFGGS